MEFVSNASPHGIVRVGLLMDSLELPAWQWEALREMVESDFCRIVLVIQNVQDPPPTRRWPQWPYLLHTLYSVFDAKWFRGSPDAFARRGADALLRNVPRIAVRPLRTEFSDRFGDEDIARIREYGLDVLVRLGFRILRGEILSLETARCGVWSFHHGDNQVNRGGPPGFWEVFNKEPLTGVTLQILNEDLDNGMVLARTWSSTDPVSVVRNRNRYYWKSVCLLLRQLRKLARLGAGEFLRQQRQPANPLAFYCRPLYQTPRNLAFLRALTRHVWWYAAFRFGKAVYRDQWGLAFDLHARLRTSLYRYRPLLPPLDRFWADPFVVRRGGVYYIFIEELLYASGKGHISVIEMEEKGNWKQPRPVLERPYHLSYPFLFEYQGTTYMLPETRANRTIEVYRCTAFPDRWEPSHTLMSGVRAVDATLYERGGKWWMFVNMSEQEGASEWDELFLFFSDSPLSENWTPHPANPIVSDASRARPAGCIFEHEGELYRPSQDCSVRYGYGLRLNRIVQWTETEYAEAEATKAEPVWREGLRGVHTFNRTGRLSVIDCIRRRSKWF